MKTYTAITPVNDDRNAVDLIAEAHYAHGAEWVLLPVELLPGAFFQLRSGVAGAIAQKFVDYRMGLLIVGDVSPHLAASSAFREWVWETNRGRRLRFVPDLDAALSWLHGRGSDSAGAGAASAADPAAGLA